MLRIRIVSAGVVAALAVALAASAATAQTTTNSPVGKPLSLLAGLLPSQAIKQQHEKKTHQAKVAVHHVKAAHKKLAARTSRKPVAPPAETTAPSQVADAPAPTPAQIVNLDNIWPIPAPNTPANTAPSADATSATNAAPRSDALSETALVVNGQTVQIAAPDEVNAIDLAADDNATKPAATNAAPSAQTVLTTHADADPNDNPVGSASWIAQVLAALGGAAAAGTVAWFLIGSGPQRMYG
jgi:hypothetical protein